MTKKAFDKTFLRSAAACLLLSPTAALAQGGATAVDTYSPSARARDGFQVGTADVDRDGALHGALVFDYANDPLVLENDQGSASSESAQVVQHHFVMHALFSYALVDRLQLTVSLPVGLVQRGDDGLPAGVAGADGFGLGDAFLGARARLLGDADARFSLAVQANVAFPTARLADDGQHYHGDESVVVSPTVLAHVNIGILKVAVNVGARIRRDQTFLGVARGDELTYGVAGILGFRDDSIQVSGELYGSSAFADFAERESTPFEGLAGAKWFHDSGLYVGGGLGMGFVRGFGSPDLRALLSVGFASPAEVEAPVVEPEPEPEPAAPVDSDGDGLLDPDDACPADAEDRDGFEDTEGCPDPDNDRDGVPDVQDGAPNDPEDADSFEDGDGVPDPDNDRDGVPDAQDACVNEPGPAEFQGCQPPDRDGDTVVDPRDNCPDEPGTVENHGCSQTQQVVIEGDRLEIVDNVYFRTNRDVIERRSFALLDNVAAVLSAHPEITHVRIEGHTDARGDHDANVRLSQARAEAVVRYLVRRGVEASRLDGRGFGPDQPVVPNATTPDEHARNRRVEFRIDGIANRASGPSADTVDR